MSEHDTTTILEAVRLTLERRAMSVSAAAELAEVDRGYLTQALLGTREVDLGFALKVADSLGILRLKKPPRKTRNSAR